jgi:hypothetical protein
VPPSDVAEPLDPQLASRSDAERASSRRLSEGNAARRGAKVWSIGVYFMFNPHGPAVDGKEKSPTDDLGVSRY